MGCSCSKSKYNWTWNRDLVETDQEFSRVLDNRRNEILMEVEALADPADFDDEMVTEWIDLTKERDKFLQKAFRESRRQEMIESLTELSRCLAAVNRMMIHADMPVRIPMDLQSSIGQCRRHVAAYLSQELMLTQQQQQQQQRIPLPYLDGSARQKTDGSEESTQETTTASTSIEPKSDSSPILPKKQAASNGAAADDEEEPMKSSETSSSCCSNVHDHFHNDQPHDLNDLNESDEEGAASSSSPIHSSEELYATPRSTLASSNRSFDYPPSAKVMSQLARNVFFGGVPADMKRYMDCGDEAEDGNRGSTSMMLLLDEEEEQDLDDKASSKSVD